MAYTYSKRSLSRLEECHPDLQKLFKEVLKVCDHTILCGHRNEADQNEAFNNGNSKLQWPKSKHNKKPSLAVDAIKYPINWTDYKSQFFFGGIVIGIASTMGIKIRWGSDWDKDNDFSDNPFNDAAHFELEI